MSHNSSLVPPGRTGPELCRQVCRHRVQRQQAVPPLVLPIPNFSTFFPHFLSRDHSNDKKTLVLESEAYLQTE